MLAEGLSTRGISLRRYDIGTVKTLCPKCHGGSTHEKSLSVTINSDGAVWLCHRASCGWADGLKEEVRLNKPKPIISSDPDTGSLYGWFSARKISRKTVDLYNIKAVRGSYGVAMALPYSRGGDLVNVKYRKLEKKEFFQDAGCEQTLFGVDRLKDQTVGYFVEGEMDVLAMAEAGLVAVTLPAGAGTGEGTFKGLGNCHDLVSHISKWVIAGDSDAPGLAYVNELARRLGKERCWLVTWPDGCKDANATLINHGIEGVRSAVEAAKPHPIASLFRAKDFSDKIDSLYKRGYMRGISLGWPELDPLYTIRPGELSVVTGVPGSGKTTWLLAAAKNLADDKDWKLGLCLFENPPEDNIITLAENFIGLPFSEGPNERMSKAQLSTAQGWIDEHFWFIWSEEESPTIDWIIEKARAAVVRYGILGLMVDPYNKIEHHIPEGMNEASYVALVLAKLKRFAISHGCHVWIVAHPNKLQRRQDGTYPIPTMYDISGSAHWYNAPDCGVVIHRDKVTGQVDVHIQKIRFKAVGEPGVASFDFDRLTNQYRGKRDWM